MNIIILILHIAITVYVSITPRVANMHCTNNELHLSLHVLDLCIICS